MASYTLSGSISNNKQGDYNSSGSSSFSNSAIKINFSSALTNFRKAVDVKAITISSAYMYITCTASGKSAKKYFNIRYYGPNLWQNIRSNGIAFDRQTSLTFDNNKIWEWIQSGSYIYSYDPQIKEKGKTSSSGGRYSENYVKISKAYIVINYTINKTSFINPPSNFDFRINNELTWKPNDSAYTHTITIKPEGATEPYTLLENNKITDNCIDNVSFKVDTENKNQSINFLLPEEIAEKYMIDKITLKANLSIQTFNKNSDPLGTETKSITLSIDPENYPYNISITEENLKNLTPWPDEEHLIIIANHTKPKFSIKASSDLGANVVACFYRFEDGQTFKVEKEENSDIFSCEPIFTNLENTELEVNITLTDSRGINSQEIVAFTGASLLNKSLLNFSYLPKIHDHDENCIKKVLNCQERIHVHGENCYDANGILICGQKEHKHDDNCYVEKPICSEKYQTSPIMIYGYQKPEIKNFSIQRYFEKEENKYILDEFEGKHIKITSEINNTPIINKGNNPLKYFLKIQDNKTSEILYWDSNNTEVFKQIDIEDYLPLAHNDLELSITLKISDSFNFYEKTFILDSAHYLLHFRKGQNSIGIGTAALDISGMKDDNDNDIDGLITLGWPLRLQDSLSIDSGGTGAASIAGIQKIIGNLMYPIGSIYMSINSKSPAEIFGGEWESWGGGKVPVSTNIKATSIEGLFDPKKLSVDEDEPSVAGKTGGYSDATLISHSHVAGYERIDAYAGGGSYDGVLAGKFTGTTPYYTSRVGYDADKGVFEDNGYTHDTDVEIYEKLENGEHISGKNMNYPPYVTCYIWHRTK